MAEIEALKLENETHKTTAEEARKQAEALQQTVNAAKAKGQKVSEPVPGSYKAEWTDAQGKKQTKVVEFKDGRGLSILPKIDSYEQLSGQYVANESLLLLANGKEAKKEHLERHPALAKLGKEGAQAVLTHFAGIKAGFLK